MQTNMPRAAGMSKTAWSLTTHPVLQVRSARTLMRQRPTARISNRPSSIQRWLTTSIKVPATVTPWTAQQATPLCDHAARRRWRRVLLQGTPRKKGRHQAADIVRAHSRGHLH